MSELRSVLPNGLTVRISARCVDSGISVSAVACRDTFTAAYDEEYRLKVAEHERHVATHGLLSSSGPLTGAELYMDDMRLLGENGERPPHSLVKRTGGLGTEWAIEWWSPDWQPDEVQIVSGGAALVLLRVEPGMH